jgi:hypothetical protein
MSPNPNTNNSQPVLMSSDRPSLFMKALLLASLISFFTARKVDCSETGFSSRQKKLTSLRCIYKSDHVMHDGISR